MIEGCVVSMAISSNRNRIEFGISLGERDSAIVRYHDCLAAHEITGVGKILVRVHNEDHAFLEADLAGVVELSWPVGGDAESMATHPHIGWATIVAITCAAQ